MKEPYLTNIKSCLIIKMLWYMFHTRYRQVMGQFNADVLDGISWRFISWFVSLDEVYSDFGNGKFHKYLQIIHSFCVFQSRSPHVLFAIVLDKWWSRWPEKDPRWSTTVTRPLRMCKWETRAVFFSCEQATKNTVKQRMMKKGILGQFYAIFYW